MGAHYLDYIDLYQVHKNRLKGTTRMKKKLQAHVHRDIIYTENYANFPFAEYFYVETKE